MKKIIIVGAALIVLAAAVFFISGPAGLFTSKFDLGRAKPFLENRRVGLDYLAASLSQEDLPETLRPQAAELTALARDTHAEVSEILALHEAGKTRTALKAYRNLLGRTMAAHEVAESLRDQVRKARDAALKPYHGTDTVYTEESWNALQQELGRTLRPRDVSAARQAYVMQPVDGRAIDLLTGTLTDLAETEELLFFLEQNYEIVFKRVKSYGAATTALDYGIALQDLAGDSAKARAVLEGPVEAILADPHTDPVRFNDAIAAYLAALQATKADKIRARIRDNMVDAARTRIHELDASVPENGELAAAAPAVKAEFRIEAARRLHELGLTAAAVPFLEDAIAQFPPNRTAGLDTRTEAQALLDDYRGAAD